MATGERRAWYMLTVVCITLIAFGILYAAGFGPRSAGALGLIGFVGLAPCLGWQQRRRGEVVDDERDRQITRRAGASGAMAVVQSLVVVILLTIFLRGSESTVTLTINQLATVPMAGMVIFYCVHSLWSIYLYRRARG